MYVFFKTLVATGTCLHQELPHCPTLMQAVNRTKQRVASLFPVVMGMQ